MSSLHRLSVKLQKPRGEHSVSLMQLVPHASPLHTKGAHGVFDVLHAPNPSQVSTVAVPPEQLDVPQDVELTYRRQLPWPSQVPSLWHVATGS